MARQWIGYMVSIECANDKGIYQGEITAATNTEITLTKAFCDGIPYKTPEITVRYEHNGITVRIMYVKYKFCQQG